jgi:microcystin synthetase protein McyG
MRSDEMSQPSAEDENALTSRRLLSALDDAIAKLEAHRRARFEPIAVVGMGCRFPGGSDDPAAFWHILREGVNTIGEIPPDRWDVDCSYDPDPEAPGKIYVRRGGFLARVDGFDARFFEISPREAVAMDPQQRLLLEVAWESLEGAGLAAERLRGSRTGVFVGITTNDYGGLLRADPTRIDAYYSTGNALNAAAGRVAHVLGLEGPSMSVDTACSSSLVAVHLACQNLRAGECELALAGGVNLILSPDVMMSVCRARMLAPDGHCKTFDASADGYARGEGCGVVVLKRLSDALAAGDTVFALIRGTAVNHDGASGGFTVPNGRAQEALIRRALASARIEPAEIDYLEAHGTGTALGDPIEVRAAASVLSEGRPASRPLILGSVKTNVGHLEAAAGIAALIKVVLSLRHALIPRHLHFCRPNPQIAWEDFPVRVAVENTPWPSEDRPRRAAISSFGASGTNAHLIVEEAPPPGPARRNGVDRPLHVLALSAKTEDGLRQIGARYLDHLDTNSGAIWADVCHTAGTGRSHFPVRRAVVSADAADARARLSAATTLRRTGPTGQPRVAFLFPGEGTGPIAAGGELYQTQPTFRRGIDLCQEILQGHVERAPRDVLFAPGGCRRDQSPDQQPALFALEYALCELWKSWGVTPAAVLGYGLGEYAAACAAGVFSVEDGLRLVAARARLIRRPDLDGSTAVVFADEQRVASAVGTIGGEVSIAAINGLAGTVIAGSGLAVGNTIAELKARGVRSRRLQARRADVSRPTEPVLEEFERLAGRVGYRRPQLTLVSCVTGETAAADEVGADYWVRQLRQPVRFAAGLRALRRRGCNVFVQAGPGRTLLALGRRCEPDNAAVWLPSLPRCGSDWPQLLGSLARLYELGISVDWHGFDRDYARTRLPVPTYPWQRSRHWYQSDNGAEPRGTSADQDRDLATPRELRLSDVSSLFAGLETSGEFSDDERKLIPRIRTALTRRVGQSAPADPDQELVYEMEWRRLPSSGRQSPRDFLPSPRELCAQLRTDLIRAQPDPGFETFRRVMEQIEDLSIPCVAATWRELGGGLEIGSRFTLDMLVERMNVAPRYRGLLQRTAEILTAAGCLRRVGGAGEWEVVADVAAVRLDETIAELRAECPEAEAELTIFGRCAAKLADTLRGDEDPLQLLFPAGEAATATDLYRESPGARVMNDVVRDVVARAIEDLPQDRTLRVLEIGAGTGGTTAAVLPVLPPGRTEYWFTDVSPRFTTAARDTFREFPFLRYQVLNIERSPAAQGFPAEQPFDLVIAANVLHATRDLRQSASHARTVMAPGALLVLLEHTEPSRAVDLTFGLTEGWWRFADQELRQSHPLISAARWTALLQDNGYCDAESLSTARGPRDVMSKQSVIVARADAETGRVAEPSPRWLIFADRGGIGAMLGRMNEARGGVSTLVFPGETFERPGENSFRVSPSRGEDYLLLAREICPAELEEVVHLWSLDAPAGDDLDGEALDAGCHLSCGSALSLVQSLVERELPRFRRAWFVTSGAVAAGKSSHVPGLAQAPLWGLARVVASEHPELRPVRVDLDPDAPATRSARALWEEIGSGSPEDEIAFRDNSRCVMRLTRPVAVRSGGRPGSVAFRGDASYVITGGLGGLGLLVARWMATLGARSLVLVGRSQPDMHTADRRRDLEQMGVRLELVQADVSRRDEAARLMARVGTTLPPLRGVIHAAGVLEDGVIRQLNWDRFARVLHPKVAGAWHLHRLTRNMDLDFFILFSSFTAVLGTPGQANHAAANAFLDALAFERRARGLPALSINWGAWSEVGAAADRQVDERLKAKGCGTISPDQGLHLLERLWHSPAAQVAVVPVDWAQLDVDAVRRPIFSDVGLRVTATIDPGEDFLGRFRAAPPLKRRALLVDHVRREVARVLGLEGAASIEPGQGFFELGMDSLTSVDLRNRLRASLQCVLPATAAFDHPNPVALADYLLGQLDREQGRPPVALGQTGIANGAQSGSLALDALSLDEIESLIDEELESLSHG